MPDFLPDLSLALFAAALGITLMAGIIKGAVGFAMPLVMVSGLSSILDPKLALAAIILPIVVSNALQTFRTGLAPAMAAARDFWRYLLIVCIAILISAQAVAFIPDKAFYAVLGVPVVILSLIQLAGVRLHLKPKDRGWAEWVVGLISGWLGCIAGTWGPTTILYLLAIDTPKARQIVVQGVIYGVGSLALLVGHLNSGILNRDTAPLSVVLLVPALLGMWVGFKIQDRMDQALFRKVTLAVLTVAGLNLIRKSLI